MLDTFSRRCSTRSSPTSGPFARNSEPPSLSTVREIPTPPSASNWDAGAMALFPRRSVVYLDECMASSYVLIATSVRPEKVTHISRVLRSAVRRGQRRVHFNSESKAQRQSFVRLLHEIEFACVLYVCDGPVPRQSREQCISKLLGDAVDSSISRLVIEDDESLRIRERQQIARHLAGFTEQFSYTHSNAHDEPPLWISDAIGWCWNRGGAWRKSVTGFIEKVESVSA